MRHIHHIIPKHMGGTDDPSNLVELTVEEHAEAHHLLWQEHKKQEDYIAWRALSGQITMPEASREAWILGSYKGGYASKPRTVPAHNKSHVYCVGCQERVKKPYLLKTSHTLCFQKKFGLPPTPNLGHVSSEDGKKMAAKNNATVSCPHCSKSGQYRAMKRWHFDNCPSNP